MIRSHSPNRLPRSCAVISGCSAMAAISNSFSFIIVGICSLLYIILFTEVNTEMSSTKWAFTLSPSLADIRTLPLRRGTRWIFGRPFPPTPRSCRSAVLTDRRGVSFDGKKQINVVMKDNSLVHTVVAVFLNER